MIRLLLLTVFLCSSFVASSKPDLEQQFAVLLDVKDTDLLYDSEFLEKQLGTRKYKTDKVLNFNSYYDCELRQRIYRIMKRNKDTDYHLIYFSIDDEVVYAELCTYNYLEDKGVMLRSKRHENPLLTKAEEEYKKLYGKPLDFCYVNRSRYPNRNVLAFRKDGYSTSVEVGIMKEFVEKKDIKGLQEMLTSISRPFKAYGLIGLEILRRKGMDINVAQLAKKTIDHNPVIVLMKEDVCCTYMRFKILLKNEYVQRYIEKQVNEE